MTDMACIERDPGLRVDCDRLDENEICLKLNVLTVKYSRNSTKY